MQRLVLLFTAILFTASITAQELAEARPASKPSGSDSVALTGIKKMVDEGNKLLSKGHFGAALPVWQKVLEADPQNADYNFKTGLCYRNSLDEQVKAVQYFRAASKDMTYKYNFSDPAARQAPVDALYFLGETFLMANLPDSAYDYFSTYQDKYNGNPPISVQKQLLACNNARRASRFPRDVTLMRLGGGINTNFAESNPVVTIDNSIMFYSTRRLRKDASNQEQIDPVTGSYYEDIYIAKKDGSGKWENQGIFNLSSDQSEAPLYLAPDGLTLYLKREEKGVSNIYVSKFADGVWGKAEALSAVNSPFNENGVSVSGDGKWLFFSSDREGGVGGYDIYVCEKKSSGKWGPPMNLGNVINTPQSEISPFIHPNGNTLFFSSKGYPNKGVGGYDIYYSEKRENGTWSEPQSMGYPINSTRDDIHYYITEGGTRYYAAINKDNSYEIFQVTGGGFAVEALDAGTEVVTLTKEMDVTQVLEVVEEVETEVEVIETVETEVIKETEVEVVDLTALEDMNLGKGMDPEVAKAEAERAKAEAEKAKAEAEIRKAEAEIAAAERAKAEAAKAEADAQRAKAEAEIAAAERAKAEAEIAKAEAEKAKALAEIAAAERAKAVADSLQAAAKIAETEAKKAEAEKAKADAKRAKEERKSAKDMAKLAAQKQAEADAEKAKEDRMRAEADAEKERAAAQRAQAEAEKAAADKAKAEAEIKAAEKAQAEAERAKAEAQKAEADKIKAQADAEQEKAAAERAKSEAATAAAQQAKADADRLKAEAEKSRADADKAKADQAAAQAAADKEKAAAQKAEAEARAAEAQKAQEEAAKAREQAAAEKVKADAVIAEKAKAEAEAKAAEAAAAKEKAAADKAKAEAEKEAAAKARAEAEAESKRIAAEQAAAAAQKAADEKAKAAEEKAKAQAQAETKKAEADAAKAAAAKAAAEAEKAKADAERAKAEAEKARLEKEKEGGE